MRVLLSMAGQADFERLPATIQARVIGIIDRLAKWPSVSGAKPLRGEWWGHYRIRTGDWRIVFRVVAPDVIVVRIMHRSKV
jgi:mRNA-degrading endonuclease RelE of RelBE toxin-antitoxin system